MKKTAIAIVAPCFNEGYTIISFLKELEQSIKGLEETFQVIVVDDCSQDNTLALLIQFNFTACNISYHLLGLKFNLGHQGAIYQGLLYASTQVDVSHAIVMDSDGEDDPAAIPSLLQHKAFDIVEVKRGKRSEGLKFRTFYFFYKLLFRTITGTVLDFGNYCLVSRNILERIQYTSFIHFPAFLLKQKARKSQIIWDRTKRLDGKSKMSFTMLFFHALRSLIEFAEDLLMLFMKIFFVITILLLIVVGNILYQKFIAGTAILGWFSTLAIGLVNLAVMCIGFFILGVLLLNLIHQQNRRSYKEIFTILKS